MGFKENYYKTLDALKHATGLKGKGLYISDILVLTTDYVYLSTLALTKNKRRCNTAETPKEADNSPININFLAHLNCNCVCNAPDGRQAQGKDYFIHKIKYKCSTFDTK